MMQRDINEGNRATARRDSASAGASRAGTVSQDDTGNGIKVGSVLRASSADRSPFLLKNQEYHKSLVLIVTEDDYFHAGVLLNHPATKGVELELASRADPSTKSTITIPVRYGGPYTIKGDGSGAPTPQGNGPMWLHMSRKLRVCGVGESVGEEEDGAMIWRCTQEAAIAAIGDNLAKPSDFFIVSGISVWQGPDGMGAEVESGRFEVVPPSQVSSMWEKLQEQDVLTKMNLIKTLSHGNDAWEAAGGNVGDTATSLSANDDGPVTDGIGEGFDEEDDSLVFKTDVQVSKLSDDALRSWVATFLLGAPSLGA